MSCLRSSFSVPVVNPVLHRRPRSRGTTCASYSNDQRIASSVSAGDPVEQAIAGVPWPIDRGEDIYEGIYGPWQVTKADVSEVLAYRAGIILAAACSLGVYVGAQVGPDIIPPPALNALCLLASAGFGTSLVLIHIYVSEIKATIQFLFAVGVLGGLWLAVSEGSTSVAAHVAEHPSSTFLIGPAFAAVTGVAIKEGLCYGKPEAGLLALITPVWLLGHLSGLFSSQADSVAAGLFVAVFTVFAARKLSQEIKDDIGDGSVFLFRKLSEEDQNALLRRLGKSPL